MNELTKGWTEFRLGGVHSAFRCFNVGSVPLALQRGLSGTHADYLRALGTGCHMYFVVNLHCTMYDTELPLVVLIGFISFMLHDPCPSFVVCFA
jgi:hypothetical protein